MWIVPEVGVSFEANGMFFNGWRMREPGEVRPDEMWGTRLF